MNILNNLSDMGTICLKDVCGSEVLSRSNVRKLYGIVDDTTEAIDMTGVKFVSRSVADEICNILAKFPSIRLDGMNGDVETMMIIVRKGRGARRVYASKAKISMTFNCKTMDDLRKALLTFGL